MSTDRWNRLSDWHNAWLTADAAERRRLRDELTATSPDLVAEADALITASSSITGFLETPAFVLTAAQLASDEAALTPGTLVGPYQITNLIARGGVGIVYRAIDTRLHRQVALKTLAPLGTPDERSVDRFFVKRESRHRSITRTSSRSTTSARMTVSRSWSSNCSKVRRCGSDSIEDPSSSRTFVG